MVKPMLDIYVTHRSDASSAVKLHCSDQELFYASVMQLKEQIAAPLRHFDFELHHWIIIPEGREFLASYLRHMESVYCANVEIGYETEEERADREARERVRAQEQQQKERSRTHRQTHKRPRQEAAAPHSGQQMTAALAYRTLYLTPEAPPEMIQAAFRTLAKLHHPDVGGETQVMALINEAYNFLLETLKKEADAA